MTARPKIESIPSPAPAHRRTAGKVRVGGRVFLAAPFGGACDHHAITTIIAAIRSAYETGMEIAMMEKVWRISWHTIRALMRALGVPLRRHGGRQKSHIGMKGV